MITKLTDINLEKYTKLWAKASEDLTANSKWDTEENDPGAKDKKISSLKQYFHYIKDLAGIDEKYLMLPADEDIIDIDANTREINIRNTIFSTAGVGVQDDEIAETIFFRIDRYFDATDLAPLSILFHWKTADGEEGVTSNFCKDIESEEGKIIFGWPIATEITNHPGKVQFAVRFYKVEGGEVTYNFGTKIATLSVNPSMQFNKAMLDGNGNAKDWKQKILDRLTNSNLGELVIADNPKFVYYKFVDGGEFQNGNKVGIIAYSPDINDQGKISYQWFHISKDDIQTQITDGVALEKLNVSDVESTPTYHTGLKYYKALDDGGYGDIALDSTSFANEDKTKLFVEASTYTIPEAEDSLGEYYVTITNTVTYATKPGYVETGKIKVLGPTQPTLTQNLTKTAQLKENAIITLGVKSDTNVDKYTADSYQWYSHEYDETDDKFVAMDDKITDSIELTSAESNEKYYKVIVSRTKNNNTNTVESNICKTYNLPLMPRLSSPAEIVNEKLYTGVEYQFTGTSSDKHPGIITYKLVNANGGETSFDAPFTYTFTSTGSYTVYVYQKKEDHTSTRNYSFSVVLSEATGE